MKDALALPQMTMGITLVAGAAYVTYARVAEKALPMLATTRSAFWAVAALGMVACAAVGGAAFTRTGNDWTDPWILSAAALGTLALLVVVVFAARLRLPMLATESAQLLALTAIVVAKFGLSTAHALLGK